MRLTVIFLTTLLLTAQSIIVGSQFLDCYFQETNLLPCLTNGVEGNMSDICCKALNQALSSGQECLCSILFSTNLFLDAINPIPASLIGVELPGCSLSTPSLSACQVPAVVVTPPPATEGTSPDSQLVPNNETESEPVPEGQFGTGPNSQFVPNNETDPEPVREGPFGTSPNSQFVQNNETKSELVPERQNPIDVVSQVNQNGGSGERQMEMMHHMVWVTLAFLVVIFARDIF